MIRIKILKNNIVTNQADFKTQAELDLWFNANKANNSFGKNNRELQARKDIDGNWFVDNEDITKAASFREETDLDGTIKRYYSFAADYIVQQIDVTAEYDAIKAKQDAIKIAVEDLVTVKPVMTVPELSNAVNKILVVLGIK